MCLSLSHWWEITGRRCNFTASIRRGCVNSSHPRVKCLSISQLCQRILHNWWRVSAPARFLSFGVGREKRCDENRRQNVGQGQVLWVMPDVESCQMGMSLVYPVTT